MILNIFNIFHLQKCSIFRVYLCDRQIEIHQSGRTRVSAHPTRYAYWGETGRGHLKTPRLGQSYRIVPSCIASDTCDKAFQC